MRCRNASLREVPPGVPKTAVTLDLSFNAISELTNVSFSSNGMGQLTSLYIYRNMIAIIEEGAFRNLRVLKGLFMGHNRLTYIHTDTFKHNAELEVLDLHGNNVSLRDRGPFSHLANLRVLNISGCNLSNISKETFRKTLKLISLDMSNNKLTHIDDHLFDRLNSLQFLNLSRNLLASVDFLLAMPRIHLREVTLYVSNNKLGNFSNDVLERLGSLGKLSIHNNPLSCRCWDESMSLHVWRPCSEPLEKWETHMVNSSNGTRTCVAEAISRETRSAEISVSEKIDHEFSGLQKLVTLKNLSAFGVNNDDLSTVADAPVLQQSSETLADTETIVVTVILSLALVMLVLLLGICFCPRISRSKSPAADGRDAVPEERNCLQQTECRVCRIYRNHTPTCIHGVSKQSNEASKEHNLHFGIQSSLQTYELIVRGSHDECFLYVSRDEGDLTYFRNPHSGSGLSSAMPSAVARHQLETDTTANRTHPSCSIADQEDTVSEHTSDASEYGNRVLNVPRHSCNRAICYVVCPSDGITVSGGQAALPDTHATNV
jgi:hypothetical protein